MSRVREKQQSLRTRSLRRRRARFSCALWFCGTLVVVGLGVGWLLHALLPGRDLFLDTHYKVEGSPTIDASFINQVLAAYNSPARDKGQVLYDLGVRYTIDPVYALAFFLHESGFGTTGVARVTLSLGNIRATAGYENYAGYRRYKSWEAGFEDWYRLIRVQYIQKWGLASIDQIVPVYAPGADHNDVAAYIHAVKQAVDTWRSGVVQV
ncbi:MAG TPA: glucosaminidase domain-containing protein [Ktedonobacteraceae bacterium]|jgi:hypothetical protein